METSLHRDTELVIKAAAHHKPRHKQERGDRKDRLDERERIVFYGHYREI